MIAISQRVPKMLSGSTEEVVDGTTLFLTPQYQEIGEISRATEKTKLSYLDLLQKPCRVMLIFLRESNFFAPLMKMFSRVLRH